MTTNDLTLAPQALVRRSPLHRQHLSMGASLIQFGLGMLPDVYGNPTTDRAHVEHLGLVDLCLMPRAGYKGSGSTEFLQEFSLVSPNLPNRAARQANGMLVNQLSYDEYLLIDTSLVPSTLITTMAKAWSLDDVPDCYQVPRQDSHGCLAVTGSEASMLLSSLISVDLRLHRFANFQIAQTVLNELSVIVIRCDLGDVPNYYLLTDITSIEFLWAVLLDGMAEAGGGPVGLAAFNALQRPRS